ncbi:patatin-like phospholipase family protein, partial [Proteus faecis]|uniref:patatin-like phospholipase family protein n=1 Tax=Proteus faecis TaxID=2050967 RepID=UPI00301C998A
TPRSPTIQVAGHRSEPQESEERSPKNILVLSGGGMNGAFTAGLLGGWTRSGTRPELDVVTGVSTGALIAPFAFLGAE